MSERWERREGKVKRRKEKPRSNRKNVELLLSSIRASARRVLGRRRKEARKGKDQGGTSPPT